MGFFADYARSKDITITVLTDHGVGQDEDGFDRRHYDLRLHNGSQGTAFDTSWFAGTTAPHPIADAGSILNDLVIEAENARTRDFESWASNYDVVPSDDTRRQYRDEVDKAPTVVAFFGGPAEFDRLVDAL